jgi:hypothetical protein
MKGNNFLVFKLELYSRYFAADRYHKRLSMDCYAQPLMISYPSKALSSEHPPVFMVSLSLHSTPTENYTDAAIAFYLLNRLNSLFSSMEDWTSVANMNKPKRFQNNCMPSRLMLAKSEALWQNVDPTYEKRFSVPCEIL